MSTVRTRGEAIRRYILDNVDKNPAGIAIITGKKFGISRQAIYKHLKKLIDGKALVAKGNTRNRTYQLHPLIEWVEHYELNKELAEDIIWRNDIVPRIGNMPENVIDIWRYGFTEMFNNAIDHSGAKLITIRLKKTATYTEIVIYDNGIGIFKKIQSELDLLDEKHAILELAKGKLTTDPDNHTGEGIFFTSRMFDDFDILSGGVYFNHNYGESEDWILDREQRSNGTGVWMRLNNHTSRTAQKVFNKFTSGENFGFTKTVVPVRLALYGDDKLVSRSQAKRLLARVDRFKIVVFDFQGVETIGQAFADEVFRVFALKHPEVQLTPIHATTNVKSMVNRVLQKES